MKSPFWISFRQGSGISAHGCRIQAESGGLELKKDHRAPNYSRNSENIHLRKGLGGYVWVPGVSCGQPGYWNIDLLGGLFEYIYGDNGLYMGFFDRFQTEFGLQTRTLSKGSGLRRSYGRGSFRFQAEALERNWDFELGVKSNQDVFIVGVPKKIQ